MTPPPITGVILAGGRGQRLGGVDKGWQPLDGQPLVRRVIERLRPQVDDMVISANRNQERYAALGYPVVADEVGGFAGPLAGLHAALALARQPWVVTVPCDSPFFPGDFTIRLLNAAQAAGAQAAVARAAGRGQPVFCLCRSDLRHRLERFLAQGGRRMGAWLAELAPVAVDFGDAAAFDNINTPEDLARLSPIQFS